MGARRRSADCLFLGVFGGCSISRKDAKTQRGWHGGAMGARRRSAGCTPLVVTVQALGKLDHPAHFEIRDRHADPDVIS